jgi:hypothetical protein
MENIWDIQGRTYGRIGVIQGFRAERIGAAIFVRSGVKSLIIDKIGQ